MLTLGGVRSGRDTNGGPEDESAAGTTTAGPDELSAEQAASPTPATPAADAPASPNSRLRVRSSVMGIASGSGSRCAVPSARSLCRIGAAEGGRTVILAG